MSEQHDEGLVIVPAGAGAGKTHRIKTTLSDWVKRGLVRPERILAVTFTEAAASELRERIRGGLLAEGLVSEALAVERAYVSTIHGLGLRILTEHALAAGSSPQPRHLADAERDLLIRQTLAHAKALDPIKAEPERFGYAPNWQQGTTVEDALRGRVLSMIDLLRGLGDKGRDAGLIDPALRRLAVVYGDVLEDPQSATQTLIRAVAAMLDAFPAGAAGSVSANTARDALQADHLAFLAVSRNPACLQNDWSLWQKLRGLRQSKRGSTLPERYDDLASAIMTAANVLPRHPGPLADASLHLRCLVACAQEVMEAYEDRKRALGLIDFADMITGAESLVRRDPVVRQAVLDEIDCVIIDEFQDTNPVQFALLWQLGSRAARTLLVGDVKQSIMGFQGADPRLSAALTTTNPDATQPLKYNWRSTPAVMEFVNALGAGLFGKAYNHLTATREQIDGPALEILHVAEGRSTRKLSKPQEHVAERIARILADGETVTDRYSNEHRAVKPSDIALLVCRHTTAGRYAQELRLRGIPVRINENGWATSAVIQAARAALSYSANPSDIHSGLLLRALGPDPEGLEDLLAQQMDGQFAADTILVKLRALSAQLSRLPVAASVGLVIEAAGLRVWADQMTDAPQARADLLRLEAEAEGFEQAHRDLKAASGFHGETVKVFLGWLDARAGDRDFDRHPDPSGESTEAVEIVTWHGAKGREWPITVVAEFDSAIAERAGTTSARFETLDRVEDMVAVLESAALLHTPVFTSPEAQDRFIEDRRADFEENARNLLYVALTRARDRLVLEWPAFLKGRDQSAPLATRLFHVFEDACTPLIESDHMRLGNTKCAVRNIYAPEIASYTVVAPHELKRAPRFGSDVPLAVPPLTPWRLQPSRASGSADVPASRSISIGKPWPVTVSNSARGTALHLAFRTYLNRPHFAPRLLAATDLAAHELQLVGERAHALRNVLNGMGFTDLRCEIPFLGHSPEGAEIPGMIDLLAIGPTGCLLIDHKSGGNGIGLGPYWPQLSAYSALMSVLMPARPLNGAAILWLDHGTMELVDLQREESHAVA
jgi:ATP-dependent helicase/nuclease subunit A